LNALEGGVVAVTCFEDSENKGLHLEGKIVEVNNNEVTMEINAENAIAIDNDPSGRFFKYDGNFFEITGISCSCDDINNIQKIVFTTKRGVSLQANKPVSLEILKSGIKLRGSILSVASTNKITVKFLSETEVEIPSDPNIEKFIRYSDKRIKITDVHASTWDRATKVLSVILTVDNPITIKKDENGIFDVDYSEVEVQFPDEIDIEENSFAGTVLRQKGKNFVIIKNAASISDSSENPVTKAVFTVQNLTLHPRDIPKINKSASLLIEASNPLFINYGKSKNWGTGSWDGMIAEVDVDGGANIEENIMVEQ